MLTKSLAVCLNFHSCERETLENLRLHWVLELQDREIHLWLEMLTVSHNLFSHSLVNNGVRLLSTPCPAKGHSLSLHYSYTWPSNLPGELQREVMCATLNLR